MLIILIITIEVVCSTNLALFQILILSAMGKIVVLGFNDTPTLVGHFVILCHLPEKGRKEIEEIAEEIKERDWEERRTGMKVKKQKK